MIIILIILILIASPKIVNGLINASLVAGNGTAIDHLSYDRKNLTIGSNTYGSNSYMDHTFTNPNALLDICHPNLTVGDKIDVVYTGLNRSYYRSILNFFPLVSSTTNYSDVNGTYNCSTIDIDISSIHALYPGLIHPVIIPQGVSYSHDNYNMGQSYFLPSVNQILNGSFDIGIGITGITKIYHLSIQKIYDEQGQEFLDVTEPYLILTLVNSSSDILLEEKLEPGEETQYDGNFKGGERIYVNEIDTLAILNYQPCNPINESGYYLFNESATGLNDTCIIINNTDNVVLNFGGELIDGDSDPGGSMRPDICSVLIKDSDNVVIEYLRAQEFYYGVCVENSTDVSIYGNYSAYNLNGAKVYNESTVKLYSIYFSNNDSEIIALDNSEVNLTNVSFFNETRIRSDMKDVIIRTVIQEPPPLNLTNFSDINQYIELNNMSNDSWATLGFYYTVPIANNVSLGNLSIYQYDADRDNSSDGWGDANWTRLYTIIDPQMRLIRTYSYDEVITNFSVFAPFGFINKSYIEEPEPEPEPEPSPSPTAGTSGSRGARPTEVQLELEIPHNITLMQGQVGEIKFNVTNIGDVFAPGVSVGPEVLEDWLYTNYSIGGMTVGLNVSGDFQIAPHERTTPKEYSVIVNAYIEEEGVISAVTSELLTVIVIPREETLARLKVLEYPPVITASPSSALNVSFLSKNIGGVFLPDIVIEIEDSPCINSIDGRYDLAVDETKSLKYLFNFTAEENECDVNIKFYSNGNLVGFVPTKILLRESLLPEMDTRTYIILLYLIWTGITAYILGRKRRHKKEEKK